MKIPTGSGMPAFTGAVQPHPARPAAAAPAHREDAARHFDQVTITAGESGCSPFEMELKSRLSQEVRTATTTGTLDALRRQIVTGQYRPDPAAIARKLLLLSEE